MHTHLRGGLVGVLLASAFWLVSCESTRAPGHPSTADGSRTLSSSVASPSAPLSVSWQCMAADVEWRSADCPSQRAGTVRLAPRLSALTAPASPSNLSGSVSSSAARVTLTWVAPGGGDPPTSYVVEAGSASGRLDLANFDTGTSATGLVVGNVPAGTYFIRVRARNGAGVSAASNELVLIVSGANGCPPAAPTNLVVSASGSTATLRWTASGGGCVPTGYIIEAGSTPGAADLANFNTGTTDTAFVAANVFAGTYYVRVRASNSAGTSAPSNEAPLTITGAGCSGVPAAPRGLIGLVNGTNVTLVWGSVSGATSYVLEAGSAPGQSNVVVSDQGVATSLSATAANGTYYVRVKARNACGASAPSNEVVLNVGSATCNFTVSPTTQSLSNAGGSATATVTASSGCAWTAASNASFITVTSGASGSGNGTVTYSVAANAGAAPRTGTLTIAGQTVTVSQGAPPAQCTLTISPSAVSFDATGGTTSVNVIASAPACTWTAQSPAAYISVTSGQSGTGSGTVTVAIQANPGSRRSNTVTIAGQALNVSEEAPLPPVTRNVGCPNQSASPAGNTSIQFINVTNDTITVFRPGTTDQSSVPPQSGYTQSTLTGTVWQVKTATQPCVASYSATASPGSAIVQP